MATSMKSPFRLFRKHSSPSAPGEDASSGDSNPILGTADIGYRMGSDASSSYNNPEDGNASRPGSEPPSPLPILGSPKHRRPSSAASPQIANTVSASSSRFRFSPKTVLRKRKSSNAPTSLALDSQLDDDDNFTEDDVQVIRRNQALRKSVSNEETSRGDNNFSGMSSPISAPVIVEPQSPSVSGFGFGFTPKSFRHGSSSKKDKSGGESLPRSYSSRADHRRTVSDQVASDVLHGRKKANSEYDLLPPLPPGIMIGSPSNTSHASHPSRPAMSPRVSTSNSPRSSALAETFQVEIVRFYKTGYPTVWFQPKVETESNGYVVDGYRVEVICSSSNRVARGEIDLNLCSTDEEPLVIIPLGNEKHQTCNLRLTRTTTTTTTSTDSSVTSKTGTTRYFVPLSFGFISCGVLMEAKLNSTFVLELLLVLAVFTALDYFYRTRLTYSSTNQNGDEFSSYKYLARSCQVVATGNNNNNNANNGLATINELAKEQQISLLKPEERQCLQLLKDQLSRVEFKDVVNTFATFYETSEGRKLLKSFAPPGRENAKYLANAELLSTKLQEKLDDEDFMFKFLKAEKMRVSPAVKMAKKALLLRVGLDLDSIPETHPTLDEYIACSVIADASRMSLDTYTVKDKAEYRLDNAYVQTLDGYPLLFYRPGKINQRLYFKHAAGGDVGRLGTAMLTTMEAFRRDAAYHHKRTGKPSRLAFAFDLGDFSLTNLVSPFTVLQVSRLTFPVMTTCYPDLVHKLILVNVPSSFLMFWEKLVKPFVSESLTSKLIIIGKGQQCVRELRNHVSEDMIPAYLGGKMVGQLDPFKEDEFCRDKVGAVGPYTSDQGISILTNATAGIIRASGVADDKGEVVGGGSLASS